MAQKYSEMEGMMVHKALTKALNKSVKRLLEEAKEGVLSPTRENSDSNASQKRNDISKFAP